MRKLKFVLHIEFCVLQLLEQTDAFSLDLQSVTFLKVLAAHTTYEIFVEKYKSSAKVWEDRDFSANKGIIARTEANGEIREYRMKLIIVFTLIHSYLVSHV